MTFDMDSTFCLEGRMNANAKTKRRAVIRGFQNSNWEVWELEVLYTACKYLRYVAMRADEAKRAQGEDTWKQLEEAARIINRAFNLCLNDRYVEEDYHKVMDTWTDML